MKSINPKIGPYIIIAILAIVCVLSISKCSSNKIQAISNKGLYDYEHSITTKLLNKKGVEVAETKVAETFNADDIKKLSADIFQLKNSLENKIKQVDALVRVTQNIIVKDSTILKYYPVTFDSIDSMVSINTVVLPPRKFNSENKNYSIAGTVLLNGVKIDSIELNNVASFRIAEKKNGWFSQRETVVQTINSNPYFSNNNVQSIVLKHKTNAWNKWIKPTLFAAGALLINNQLK